MLYPSKAQILGRSEIVCWDGDWIREIRQFRLTLKDLWLIIQLTIHWFPELNTSGQKTMKQALFPVLQSYHESVM